MSLASIVQLAVEQDGVIDNIAISPVVHRVSGMVVLAAMLAVTGALVRLWLTQQPLDTLTRVLLAAAQISLMIQALLGIKLLDQGLGVVQLYIHYVGGLAPLGLFVAAGWFAWRDEHAKVKTLAILSIVGTVSAVMAFTIGRAFVNGS